MLRDRAEAVQAAEAERVADGNEKSGMPRLAAYGLHGHRQNEKMTGLKNPGHFFVINIYSLAFSGCC